MRRKLEVMVELLRKGTILQPPTPNFIRTHMTIKSIGNLPEKVSLILKSRIRITGVMNIPMVYQSLRLSEVLS